MLLTRNNLVTISILVTFMYAMIFFAIKDLGGAEKILTLLLMNDPAVIGLIFIGVSIILEKNQEVLPALFVTPLNYHIYLISRVFTLSLIGLLCGLGMGFAALGNSFDIVHFSFGLFGICVISALVGVYVVSSKLEVMPFILKSIPFLMLFVNLPLLNYYGITNFEPFKIFPAQGGIYLIDNAYGSPVMEEIIFGYASTILWTAVLYWVAYRTFIKKIVNA